MNDQAIEQLIQDKGKTAPRVTPDDLKANIVSEHYFTAMEGVMGAHDSGQGLNVIDTATNTKGASESIAVLGTLTFCVLVLRNGFTVSGESACASPENFDADIGREVARQNAVAKVWPLMGYALKERLNTPAE